MLSAFKYVTLMAFLLIGIAHAAVGTKCTTTAECEEAKGAL